MDRISWFVLALLTALCWGVAPLFAKAGLVRVDPWAGLAWRTLGVALAMLAIVLLGGKLQAFRSAPWRSVWRLVAEGLLAAVIGQFAYYSALKLGKAAQVVPLTAAFPIVTMVLAALVLGEKLTPGKAAGGILVVLGVVMLKIL